MTLPTVPSACPASATAAPDPTNDGPAAPVWGPLEQAAQAARTARHWARAHACLEQGARPRAIDGQGWTLLHHAANTGLSRAGDEEATTAWVQALVTAGADVNAVTRDGQVPVWMACSAGRWDLVLRLVGAGADPNTVNVHPDEDEHLLNRAVQLADVGTVRALLDQGAALHRWNGQQETVLGDLVWAMTQWGDGPSGKRLGETLDLLLDRGISPLGAGPNGLLPDDPMTAPLARAVERPAMPVLRRLLDLGAWRDDPRWQPWPARERLLKRTVEKGHAGALTALLDAGVARGFETASWNCLVDHLAQQMAAPARHPMPAETSRTRARLEGLRMVIEPGSLRHAMQDSPAPCVRERCRL